MPSIMHMRAYTQSSTECWKSVIIVTNVFTVYLLECKDNFALMLWQHFIILVSLKKLPVKLTEPDFLKADLVLHCAFRYFTVPKRKSALKHTISVTCK